MSDIRTNTRQKWIISSDGITSFYLQLLKEFDNYLHPVDVCMQCYSIIFFNTFGFFDIEKWGELVKPEGIELCIRDSIISKFTVCSHLNF